MNTTEQTSPRRTWIEWVLKTCADEPRTAGDLKRMFQEQFPDAGDSEYRHLMTSLTYADLLDNPGERRLSVYQITDIGEIVLKKLTGASQGK